MVITVSCPSCAASFPVDSNKIPVAGVNARCSACGHVFRVERPQEPAPPPSAPEPVIIPEPEPEPEPLPSFESDAFEVEGSIRDDDYADTGFSVGVEEPATTDGGSDSWVFETAEDIDPESLDIEPVETVESNVAGARDEGSFFGAPILTDPTEDFAAPPAPEPDLVVPPPEEPAPAVGSFTFGKRDPKEKARRLARVLVSDMIMYNPERHQRALANGTLREDFEDEIAKSWKEYIEQVGEEMAKENPFWAEALNDVLARGEQLF